MPLRIACRPVNNADGVGGALRLRTIVGQPHALAGERVNPLGGGTPLGGLRGAYPIPAFRSGCASLDSMFVAMGLGVSP